MSSTRSIHGRHGLARVPIEPSRAFHRYRAALSRYHAARADLGAEIEAGIPASSAAMRSLNAAEEALSEAWRAYVEPNPLTPRTHGRRRPKTARH